MHYKPLSYIYFNTSICEHFRNFGIYKIACAVFFLLHLATVYLHDIVRNSLQDHDNDSL